MHLIGGKMFSREINLLSMAFVVFFSALVSVRLGNKLPIPLFSIHMMKMPLKTSEEKTTSLLIGFTVLRLSVHHVVLSLLGPNLLRLNLQPISSISCRIFSLLKKVALTIYVLIRHVRLCELQSITGLGTHGRRPAALLWMPITTLTIVQMMSYVENIAIQHHQMAVHQILLVKELIGMVWFIMSGNSILKLVNNSMLGLVDLSPF
jgi:hypothetical protein